MEDASNASISQISESLKVLQKQFQISHDLKSEIEKSQNVKNKYHMEKELEDLKKKNMNLHRSILEGLNKAYKVLLFSICVKHMRVRDKYLEKRQNKKLQLTVDINFIKNELQTLTDIWKTKIENFEIENMKLQSLVNEFKFDLEHFEDLQEKLKI